MFGYTLIKQKHLGDLKEKIALFEMHADLNKKRIESQERQIKDLKNPPFKNLIDVDIGDPTPFQAEARQMYVARVAGFFTDVLKNKLLQMISATHGLQEDETNTRDVDFVLKAVIYVCREFMRWGEQAVNEQIANQTEKPRTEKEDLETTISNILV